MPAESRSLCVPPGIRGQKRFQLVRGKKGAALTGGDIHHPQFSLRFFPRAICPKKLICFESGAHAMARVNCPLKLGRL